LNRGACESITLLSGENTGKRRTALELTGPVIIGPHELTGSIQSIQRLPGILDELLSEIQRPKLPKRSDTLQRRAISQRNRKQLRPNRQSKRPPELSFRDKKNTGTNPVLLSFGPKTKWPRRPDLPFRNRSDLREFSWPDILGERTVEAVVLKLLEHLGRPTRHAGNRENWREEIRRDIE
jgi:hypothetical protein